VVLSVGSKTTVPQLFYSALIRPFIKTGFPEFNAPLWTIYYEFLGSFIVLPMAASLRGSRYRWLAYFVLIFAFSQTYYANFIGGMMLADIYVNKKMIINYFSNISSWSKSILLIVVLSIGSILPIEANYQGPFYAALMGGSKDPLWTSNQYGMVAAIFLVLFVLSWKPLQRLLSKKLVLYLGRISFALYVLHVVVLDSFGLALFNYLAPNMNYNLAGVVTSVTGILMTILLSIWATKLIEEPVLRLLRRLNKTKNLANS
jgi:peptidoglycan/LPS O-acetylase OafA/YrhL